MGKEQKWKSERRQFSIGICPTRPLQRLPVTWQPSLPCRILGRGLIKTSTHSALWDRVVTRGAAETEHSAGLAEQICISQLLTLSLSWNTSIDPCKILVSLYTFPWKKQAFLLRFAEQIPSVLPAWAERRWPVTWLPRAYWEGSHPPSSLQSHVIKSDPLSLLINTWRKRRFGWLT